MPLYPSHHSFIPSLNLVRSASSVSEAVGTLKATTRAYGTFTAGPLECLGKDHLVEQGIRGGAGWVVPEEIVVMSLHDAA